MPLKRFTDNLVTREPFFVSVLFCLTVIFFLGTRAYTAAYDRRREALGREWFGRANDDVKNNRAAAAVQAFQTALVYDPQNREYLTHLAVALVAAGQSSEALSYYKSLWQEDPRDGAVNLQLAHIAARQGNPADAENYFNGAIFGNWPDDVSSRRRDAAFEWIHFLLQRNDKNRAKSQLLALAETLPPDAVLRKRLGDDLLRADAPDFAFEQYRLALKYAPDFVPAIQAAAQTAFQLGDYHDAESYATTLLRDATSGDGSAQNQNARHLLVTIHAAGSLNPYSSTLPDEERARRVLRSFQIGGQRLQSCAPPALQGAPQSSATDPISQLLTKWREMEPSITLSNLRNNTATLDSVMKFVFSVEQQASSSCGFPSAEDTALLSIARLRSTELK